MNKRAINLSSKVLFFIFVIALSCRYASAAVQEPVKIVTPISVNLADYKKVNSEIFTDISEAKEYIQEFRDVLSKKIEESNLFDQLTDNSPDILLKTKIVEFHHASNLRFLFGFLAGAMIDSSNCTTDIDLIESKTNRVVGSFKTKAKAQTLNGVFGDISDSIIAFLKETKEKSPIQTVSTAGSTEAASKQKMNDMEASASTEKLDKLRESGVISEDEYKRAKEKIASPQADTADTNKKLQELDELHKKGILSDEDYNKAAKRLTERQKLEELRQNGILSEEEYKKAKARLTEK